jgi:hypothetical protein
MISGVGSIPLSMIDSYPPSVPSAMEWCHLLGQVRFVLPCLRSFYFYCWIRIPYPTKQVRAGLHELFSKAALGSAAYQPLSTFVLVSEQRQILLWDLQVQIFTAGSFVRALSNAMVMEMLLKSDGLNEEMKKLKTALLLEYSLFRLPTTLSDAFIQTCSERPTCFEQYGGRKWR